jgi:periplasmic protein TonB
MMEEKFEPVGHDPALLTPSEDPRRYRQQRSFRASTVGPTVSTTAATTTPRLTVKPFVVASAPALAAAPVLAAPAPPAESMAAASASATLTSWDEPDEKPRNRSWIVAACAVAAALALAVGLWIHRAASVPGPAPAAPVPAVTAVALPPVTPAAAVPTKPAVTETKGEKKLVAQETSTAADAQEEQPETPVMQIATGSAEPKPEPPAEVPAPKLNLSSGDTNIKILSRVSVAVPAAPKSHLVPPELVSQTPPVYPALAKQLGIYGAVVLHVTIKEDGSVGAVQVTNGAMQLRKAAVDAVRKWHYKPATLNGSSIEATAEVKVNFTK